MARWRFLAAVLVLGAALFHVSACQKRAEAPQSDLAGAIDDYGRWLVQDSPETASRVVGDDPALRRQLDNRTALATDLRRTAALRGLAQFEAMAASDLERDEQAQLDILLAHFRSLRPGAEMENGRFSAIYGFKPYTLDPFRASFATLPRYLAGHHPIANLSDADDYVERLEAVAPAIRAEAMRARLEAQSGIVPHPALLAKVIAIAEANAAAAPVDSPYVRSLKVRLEQIYGPLAEDGASPGSASNPAVGRARALLERAERTTRLEILPAYREVLGLARELSARPYQPKPENLGRWRDASLHFVAGGAVDADAAEAAARTRLGALSRELDMSLRSVGRIPGPVGARLAAIDQDPRFAQVADGPALAGLLRAHAAKAERLRPAWFEPVLDSKLEFRVPEADAPPGRRLLSYEPSARIPLTPALVVVNPQALAQLPRSEIATLAFHETFPGHHAQAVYAARKDRPLALRLIHFPAFSEGWATYSEQLADEFGLFESDPMGRIGFLRWQLIRTLRLLVDAGLFAHGWNREQAIAFLREEAGLSAEMASEEVDRILAAPGCASAYEIGRARIAEARERARLALGARFDIRLFHDVILGEGEIPLDVLDSRVDAWIQRRLGEERGSRLRP